MTSANVMYSTFKDHEALQRTWLRGIVMMIENKIRNYQNCTFRLFNPCVIHLVGFFSPALFYLDDELFSSRSIRIRKCELYKLKAYWGMVKPPYPAREVTTY